MTIDLTQRAAWRNVKKVRDIDFLAKPVTESENRGAGAGSFCDTRLKILLHDILASLRP